MKINELIENGKNIFDMISLSNSPIQKLGSKVIWTMFKNKYGNRELTSFTEIEFNSNGLEGVYWSLKPFEISWQKEIDWQVYVSKEMIKDDIETSNKTNTTDVVRNRGNETNDNDVDFVVPYDVVDEVEQKSKVEQNVLKEESIEKIIDKNEFVKTSKKFDNNKMKFVSDVNSVDIVNMMFDDIANMLTLQSY